MRKITCILTLLLFSLNLYCQDTIKKPVTIHRINIKTGIYRYYTRDEVYSPLIYKGLSAPLNIEYFNNNGVRNYTIYLQYGSTKLSSSITDKDNDKYIANYFNFINAQLGFSWLRYIKNYADWKLCLGGSLRNFFLYKDQFLSADKSQFGLDLFTDLNIDASIQKILCEKHLLKIDISYPIVSYVIGRMYTSEQPPEKLLRYEDQESIINIMKTGDFMTVNKFVDFDFNVLYFYSISKRFDLNFNYRFQYYQYPKLFMVKNAMHSLLIGVTIKL